MKSVVIAVIGAGAAGASLSWHLRRAGLSVALFERETVGAGASGRNAGSLIPPLDRRLTPFYEDTLDQVGTVGVHDGEASLGRSGLLALAPDEDRARAVAAALCLSHPECEPQELAAGEPIRIEPEVGAEMAGVYLAQAHTVDPLAVTRSFAKAAVDSGVELIEHVAARVVHQAGRVVGVEASADSRACDAAVVCTGATVGDVLPGTELADRIGAVWGVVASMRLPTPPRAILIEAEDLLPRAANANRALPDPDSPTLVGFGVVTRGDLSAVGHSLGVQPPDVAATVAQLIVSAQRYLPRVHAGVGRGDARLRAADIRGRSAHRRPCAGDRRRLPADRAGVPRPDHRPSHSACPLRLSGRQVAALAPVRPRPFRLNPSQK